MSDDDEERMPTDAELKLRLVDLQQQEAARQTRLSPGEQMVFAQAFTDSYTRITGPWSTPEEATRARLNAIDRGYACVMALRYSVETAREKFGDGSAIHQMVVQMLEQEAA